MSKSITLEEYETICRGLESFKAASREVQRRFVDDMRATAGLEEMARYFERIMEEQAKEASHAA